MAVYVDDAGIPAEVRNGSRIHRSRWSHLTADTQEELHEFAATLGLRREWFQPGQPIGGRPSPFWHYDLTSGKRAQALAMGALSMPSRELALYCRARAGQPTPASSDPRSAPAEERNQRRRRAAPEHPCPDCGTAELTHGREVCQACAALRNLQPSPEHEYRHLSHGNPGHMCVLPVTPPGARIEDGS
jgi:hypothetical protein